MLDLALVLAAELLELGLEGILAERGMVALPTKIELATEVHTGVDAAVPLVDCGGDATR